MLDQHVTISRSADAKPLLTRPPAAPRIPAPLSVPTAPIPAPIPIQDPASPLSPDPDFDPVAASDLRRRRHRAISETVARRARWLQPADRALVLAVYTDNIPVCELAALRADSPRTLRRHIRAIVARLLSPDFDFATQPLRHPHDVLVSAQ